ncbi:hypothetical protein F4678DRAFT_447809, partial [Xylaria arbuscula]
MQGNLSMAKVLIDHGADINALPASMPVLHNDSQTALEGASKTGKLDMIQFLLENGANIRGSMRIYYVRSASFATYNGHHALAAFLRRVGCWDDRDQALSDRPLTHRGDAIFLYVEELDDWRVFVWRFIQQKDTFQLYELIIHGDTDSDSNQDRISDGDITSAESDSPSVEYDSLQDMSDDGRIEDRQGQITIIVTRSMLDRMRSAMARAREMELGDSDIPDYRPGMDITENDFEDMEIDSDYNTD